MALLLGHGERRLALARREAGLRSEAEQLEAAGRFQQGMKDHDRDEAIRTANALHKTLMEKPLAQQAGLGWQGKHTNLVSRKAGSWLFLGIILTDAILPYDHRERDH